MGHGPSFLPGERYSESKATTVVVRIRPQAEEWSHIDVEPRLGSWCDSHIIIRGTWCEPIDVPLVHGSMLDWPWFKAQHSTGQGAS